MHNADSNEEGEAFPNFQGRHEQNITDKHLLDLLVSFRSLNEITKIDVSTGAVVWRMGGLRNEFAFPDPGPPFLGQHGLRAA